MPIYQGFRNAVSTYDEIDVEIDNLCLKWKNEGIKNQRVTFYFAGSQDFWKYLNRYKVDRQTEQNEYYNPAFSVPTFEGIVKLKNQSFSDVSEIRKNVTKLKTSKHSLVFIPEEQISIERLKQESLSVLKIFEKQFSILQRKRTYWYKYQIDTFNHSLLFIKNVDPKDHKEIHSSKFLIDTSNVLDFIKKTHDKFYELDQNEFDLISPINYYLSALDISYIDAAFGMQFFALEKLLDEIINSHSVFRNEIFDKNSEIGFKQLRKKIKALIKTEVKQKENRKLIYEKLNELNRPSFKETLRKVLNHYEISWKDLYKSDKELAFVDIRNQIFHSNTDIKFPELYKEFIRLKSIFERIILTLISWEDLSNCPNESIMERINKE